MTDPGQLPALRVLIIHGNAAEGAALAAKAEALGYTIVGRASTAQQALDLYLQHEPQVVLTDIRLDSDDAIDLAGKLLAVRRCAMFVISVETDAAVVDRAARAGVFGYLPAPVNPEALRAQIIVGLHRFADHDRLLGENRQLSQTLENRKLIERAKGIYMKHLSLGEPEAHRRLQQESQKRRMSLVDLARKIIESEELLGGR